MGSGSSRMVPRTPRHRPRSRQRDRIAAFICGGAAAFSHDDSPQIEDKLEEKSVIQSRSDDSAKISNILIAVSESSPKYSQKYGSTNEGISIGQSNNNDNECSFQSCLEIIHPERNPNQPSTSKKPVERIDTSLSSREIDNCTNVNDYHSSTNFSSSIQKIELEDSHENHFNLSSDALSIPSTNTSHVSVIPNCPSTLHVPNEDPLGSTSSSSNVTASTGSYEHRNGSVLHVDLVSISSDVLEGSGERTYGESQRDTRRLFLDAFARHSSRDVDSAMLLSSADTNTLGYRNRWPLDIVDPASAEEVEDDSVYLRRRRHGLNGVSWNSRSEIRERLHSGFGDSNGHISSCPSGLHHDGTCSCTLLETEASSARASIARIFVLAEALFEVLDEIHRQLTSPVWTMSLSLQVLDEIHRQPGSLLFSVVTVPASESIVNTLPSKIHKRVDTVLSNDDVEQCYICLADYEDGDKIRILPCHHEYHASCVDKWLKEIHGVCPLCRRDVCEAVSQSSISSL